MKLSKEFLKLSLDLIDCDKELRAKIYEYETSRKHHNFTDIIELNYFYQQQIRFIPSIRRREVYRGKHELRYTTDNIMKRIIKAREEAFGE